jgi:hypothetical protein
MKPETNEKIGRGILIGICFTAYIFLLFSVLADMLYEHLYPALLA